MPVCCMAQKYGGWCAGLPAVNRIDQEHYCKFHLPDKNPTEQAIRKLNQLVFERIEEAKSVGGTCDLSGTIFKGDISFVQYGEDNPLPPIDLTDAVFKGVADFSGCAFSEETSFVKVSFSTANFAATSFAGDADFRKAAFGGQAIFSRANFSKPVIFEMVIFNKYAHFVQACFLEGVRFTMSTFNGPALFGSVSCGADVDFTGAAFGEGAGFNNSQFESNAYFSEVSFTGLTNFNDVNFNKNTYLDNAKFSGATQFYKSVFYGEVNLTEAQFYQSVDFEYASFYGKVLFISVTFGSSASFNNSVFEFEVLFLNAHFGAECYFISSRFSDDVVCDGSHFEKPAYFWGTSLGRGYFTACFINHHLQFDQADLRRVSLTGAPVEKFKFIDCEWPHTGRNKTIFDARRAFGKGNFVLDDAGRTEPWGGDPPEPGALADVFRRLKKVAIEENDHSLAGDWHFMEKEMQRRRHWKEFIRLGKDAQYGNAFLDFLAWLVFGAYRLLCGFGERPLRALVWLIILAALPFIPFVYISDGSSTPLFQGDSFNYLPFFKAEFNNPSGWEKFFAGAWRYLVLPIQAGLFGLAVRNRMRR